MTFRTKSKWLEKYQDPSFKGVPFFLDNHEFGTGRRQVIHEFPERDVPFTEDIGKQTQTFSIQGHILGDDYFTDRDRLISAAEEKGPGTLVHPYLGNKQVSVVRLSLREDNKEGRIFRFTLELTEAGEVRFPIQSQDAIAGVTDKSIQNADTSEGLFGTIFNVLKQPQHVVDAARILVNDVAVAVNNATSIIAVASDALTEIAFSTSNLIAEVNDLINTPALLASRIRDSIELLKSVFTDHNDSKKAFSTFGTFGDDLPPIPFIDNASRKQQKFNQDIMVELVQNISLSSRAESAVKSDFLSVEEALVERDKIRALIINQQNSTTSIDQFQTLDDLDANLTKALPLNNLSQIIEIFNKDTTPALVLAYDLFEDLSKEQDIIDRNRIENPAFVPGGQIIEVLSA